MSDVDIVPLDNCDGWYRIDVATGCRMTLSRAELWRLYQKLYAIFDGGVPNEGGEK